MTDHYAEPVRLLHEAEGVKLDLARDRLRVALEHLARAAADNVLDTGRIIDALEELIEVKITEWAEPAASGPFVGPLSSEGRDILTVARRLDPGAAAPSVVARARQTLIDLVARRLDRIRRLPSDEHPHERQAQAEDIAGDLIAALQQLAIEARQHYQASSHRQQLRDHYQRALTDVVGSVEARPLLAVAIRNSSEAGRRALDNPPEWDRRLRP